MEKKIKESEGNINREKTENFLKKKFLEYYENNLIKEPPSPGLREFGVGFFGKKIAQRHLAFKDYNELNKFLREEVPFFISYSGAYYKFPAKRPMKAKEYLKSDLFYEFDADDLKTECKEKHDCWECSCGNSGKGNIEACPECGSYVKVSEWVCPSCLKETKKQTLKLIDALENEFGFKEGISINASGHKGYHIHVRNKDIENISPEARIELVDYLTGNGIDIFSLGFREDKRKNWLCPTGNVFGWSKKLLKALKEFFRNVTPEELGVIVNYSFSSSKKFLEQREFILKQIDKGQLVKAPKKNNDFWHYIFEYLIDLHKLDLDRQTSVDSYKILRVPETIHGGSGLIARNVERDSFNNFSLLDDCVVFSEKPVRIFISKTPKFYVKGSYYGPFDNEYAELPEYAAVYLLARGSAHLP